MIRSDDPGGAIVEAASNCDLAILGVRRLAGGRKAFGRISLRIARDAPCATILVSRGG